MNKQRYRDAKYSKAENSTSRLYLGIHHYWDRRHFQGRQQRLLRQARENIPSKVGNHKEPHSAQLDAMLECRALSKRHSITGLVGMQFITTAMADRAT